MTIEEKENRDYTDSKDRSRFKDRNPSWKRQSSFRKKGSSVDSEEVIIDYKDARALQRFTSERGKILPRRLSSVSSKNQRKLAVAIKRARFLALLPYVAN